MWGSRRSPNIGKIRIIQQTREARSARQLYINIGKIRIIQQTRGGSLRSPIIYIIIYKYRENSDNSTDKGGSLRSPIIYIIIYKYRENSDNSTD